MEPSGRLSDGRAELFRHPFCPGQDQWAWSQGSSEGADQEDPQGDCLRGASRTGTRRPSRDERTRCRKASFRGEALGGRSMLGRRALIARTPRWSPARVPRPAARTLSQATICSRTTGRSSKMRPYAWLCPDPRSVWNSCSILMLFRLQPRGRASRHCPSTGASPSARGGDLHRSWSACPASVRELPGYLCRPILHIPTGRVAEIGTEVLPGADRRALNRAKPSTQPVSDHPPRRCDILEWQTMNRPNLIFIGDSAAAPQARRRLSAIARGRSAQMRAARLSFLGYGIGPGLAIGLRLSNSGSLRAERLATRRRGSRCISRSPACRQDPAA